MKVILITGASRGIGNGLFHYYLQRDYCVVGWSRQRATTPNIGVVLSQSVDVTDAYAIKSALAGVVKKFGRIDVLINNAGVASMNHSFLMPTGTAQNILNTNVLGTFLCSREVAKIMSRHGGGKIVNFSSFAVPFKLEGEAMYAASKAAVESLTEILSKEYDQYNIQVNAVAPPAIKTDLIKGVPQDKMDKLLQRQTMHRYGTILEVARVIDFLIDDDTMVTGQTIYMGGV